ncbi:hypothetical protein DFH06DRAFT_548366 [Mycena polygramma]|nr:hypothetical protein DFH06DRAFT_548366 [Mycena polygramma]
MADLPKAEHPCPRESPPTISIDVPPCTPTTTEPQDIFGMQEFPEQQTANAAVDAAYRTASSLGVGPASEDKVAGIEDYTSSHFDAAQAVKAYCAQHSGVFDHAINVLESFPDLKSFDSTFVEVSKVLVDGMHLLGELHPFVKVMVLPLKLILTFDLTRRQNNKKVTAVKMQILDTATVLFRLRDVHESTITGPDGLPLQDMVHLITRIAEDIKECASACDLYLNKNNLSKMLRSKDYEKRFGDYIKTFNGHQRTLTLRLTVFTSVAIGAANDKLDVQGQGLIMLQGQVERLFRKLDTPREREVQKFIVTKGGPKACVENDVILKELVEKTGESLESLVPARSGKGDGETMKRLLDDARKVLNKELMEDVDQAFSKHMGDFDRKLKAQETHIIDAIGAVIGGLSRGVHTKVKDPDLKMLWEQEKWKGSVHARDFVLALNEYFASKLEHSKPVERTFNFLTTESPPDSPTSSVGDYHLPEFDKHDSQWALAYINLAHQQPLLDVIDTDGSGEINIAEANHFARLRPAGWSLIRWFTLWAAGWHLTVTWYRYRIYKIIGAMLTVVHHVKPANIQAADTYMNSWGIYNVELMLRTTRPTESEYFHKDNTQLKDLAREFHDLEEAKLKSQLKQLRYKLDNIDTLQLVTGAQSSGLRRIEVHLYPLLYLLLQRHLAIMQLACVHDLHADEFPTMSTSLGTIFSAVRYRMKRLGGMFKSNVKDGNEGFKHFAFGMFEQLYCASKQQGRDLRGNTIRHELNEEDDGLKDPENIGPNPDDDPASAMAFFAGIDSGILLNEIPDGPLQLPNPSLETPQSSEDAVEPNGLDGLWTGQLFFPDNSVPYGTTAMQLIQTGDSFSGVAENSTGLLKVTGTIEGSNLVRFTIAWPEGTGYQIECKGPHAPWADTIAGLWAPKADSQEELDTTSNAVTSRRLSLRFVFRRPSSFRTTDGTSRASARWALVIAATTNMIGPTTLRKTRAQMQCSWLVDRLAERKRFIDLAKREMADLQGISTPWGALSEVEAAELQRLKIHLRPCDARVYTSLAEYELQQLVDHGRTCDSCRKRVWGTRYFCRQCTDGILCDGIDLCLECHLQARDICKGLRFTHTKSHTLLKTAHRIHDGDVAHILQQAENVADQVKGRFLQATQAPALRIDGPPQPSSYVNTSQPPVQHQQLRCCYCEKTLSLPFWACFECDGKACVCLDCDAKGSAIGHCGPFCLGTTTSHEKDGSMAYKVNSPKHKPGCCPLAARSNPEHKLSHLLVQAVDTESVAEPQVTNLTLTDVMKKLEEIEDKNSKRLDEIEDNSNKRLDKIEDNFNAMLETLLSELAKE